MNATRKVIIAAMLFAGAAIGQTLNVSSPPPPAVSQLGYNQSGTLGITTYYYQVVAVSQRICL